MLASARCVTIAKELLKPPLYVFLLCFKSAVFSLLENDHLTHSESERHTKHMAFYCVPTTKITIAEWRRRCASNFICRPIKRKMIVRIGGLRAWLAHEDKHKPPTTISSAALPAYAWACALLLERGPRSNIYPESASCHSISRFAFASALVKCEKCLPYLFMCWKRPASYPLDRSAHLNHRKFSSTTGRYESLIQPTGCFAEIPPGFGGNPGLLAPRSLIMSLSHRLCETTLTQHFPRKAQTMFLRSGHDSERPLLNY